jgi:hypothetical protein
MVAHLACSMNSDWKYIGGRETSSFRACLVQNVDRVPFRAVSNEISDLRRQFPTGEKSAFDNHVSQSARCLTSVAGGNGEDEPTGSNAPSDSVEGAVESGEQCVVLPAGQVEYPR